MFGSNSGSIKTAGSSGVTALKGMVRGGMEPDGIHMSALGYGAALTEGGLRYGQNRRNLGVLRALAKLRAVVFDDGPPDG